MKWTSPDKLLFVGPSAWARTSVVQRVTSSHRWKPAYFGLTGWMLPICRHGASHLIASNSKLGTTISVLLFLFKYIKQPDVTSPFASWAKPSSLVVWLHGRQIKCSTNRPSPYRSSPKPLHTYLISFLWHSEKYPLLHSFFFRYFLKTTVCLDTRRIFKKPFQNTYLPKALVEVEKTVF